MCGSSDKPDLTNPSLRSFLLPVTGGGRVSPCSPGSADAGDVVCKHGAIVLGARTAARGQRERDPDRTSCECSELVGNPVPGAPAAGRQGPAEPVRDRLSPLHS